MTMSDFRKMPNKERNLAKDLELQLEVVDGYQEASELTSRLQQSLQSTVDENIRLRALFDRSVEYAQQLTKNSEHLSAQNTILSKKIGDAEGMRAQISSLEASLTAREGYLEDSKAELDRINSQLVQLKEILSESQESHTLTTSTLKSTQQELAKLSEESNATRRALEDKDAAILDIKATLSLRSEEAFKVNLELSESRALLENFHQQAFDLQTELSRASDELEAQKRKESKQLIDLARIQSDYTLAESARCTVEDELSRSIERFEALKDELKSTIATGVQEKEQIGEELIKVRDESELRVAKLRRELDEAKSANVESEQRVETLKARLQTAESKIALLTQQTEEMKRKLEDVSEESERQYAKYQEALRSQNWDLEASKERSRQDRLEWNAYSEKIESNLNKSLSRTRKIGRELDEANAKIIQYESQLLNNTNLSRPPSISASSGPSLRMFDKLLSKGKNKSTQQESLSPLNASRSPLAQMEDLVAQRTNQGKEAEEKLSKLRNETNATIKSLTLDIDSLRSMLDAERLTSRQQEHDFVRRQEEFVAQVKCYEDLLQKENEAHKLELRKLNEALAKSAEEKKISLGSPTGELDVTKHHDSHDKDSPPALEQLRSVLIWLAERDSNAAENLFRVYLQALCSHNQTGWERQVPHLDLKAHAFMAEQCIKLMSVLKRNICSLELNYSPSLDNATEQLRDSLPLELRYACVHWISHLSTSDASLIDEGLVDEFLRAHFFHWLEVMSLLRKADSCEELISQLERLFHPRGFPKLATVLRSTKRFVSKYISTIRATPLQLYRCITFQAYQTLKGHSNSVWSVAFSPDSAWLASGSDDTTVKIWDASSGACLQTLKGHSSYVSSVALSPDSAWLASGSWDKTVKIWDTSSGACLQTLKGHSYYVGSVAFSPDSAWLASGSWDKTVKIWDVSSGACLQTLGGYSDSVNTVAFSPDSAWLASGSYDKIVKIWDASSWTCLQTLEGHSSWVRSVAFSPDSAWLASGSDDKTVKIWDASSGTCLQTLGGHSDSVWSVAFSPDSAWLASGSRDKTVKIWDASSWACLQTLEGHSDYVWSVAFSSDLAWLASGSHDKTVKIWDTSNGACLQTLEGHGDKMFSVAFSPN